MGVCRKQPAGLHTLQIPSSRSRNQCVSWIWLGLAQSILRQ